jgi:hypothetical protein
MTDIATPHAPPTGALLPSGDDRRVTKLFQFYEAREYATNARAQLLRRQFKSSKHCDRLKRAPFAVRALANEKRSERTWLKVSSSPRFFWPV